MKEYHMGAKTNSEKGTPHKAQQCVEKLEMDQ